jgi:Flagellar hook-length control protein FliK
MSVESINPVAAVPDANTPALNTLLQALDLKIGQSVQAQVAAMISETIARLVIGEATIDVTTPQPLPVGATLTLTVERQGQALRLLLAAMDDPGAMPSAATAAPRAPAPLAPALQLLAALVELAARPPADAAAPATSPAPATVPAAPAPPLAPTAPAAQSPAMGQAMGQAPVEAGLEPGGAGSAPAARAPTASPQEALKDAVRQAAGRQDGMAPLFADIAAIATSPQAAALPEPVARAMLLLFGMRLPAAVIATPAGLARAVAASGIFLESTLATASGPATDLKGADLKAVLGTLRDALASWSRELGVGDRAPAGHRSFDHERPPVRGALPQGQPVARPSLSDDAGPADLAGRLLERTEAALARVTLSQAASLPDARDLGRADVPSSQATMEVPIRIGTGTAVMQFQIQRDRDQEATIRTGSPSYDWTMRFSMDAEPLGPVHAAVRWRDGHVRVQLWAERDGIADRLDAARDQLNSALEASQFTVDQLAILAGRPADPREAAPHRRVPSLDRLT